MPRLLFCSLAVLYLVPLLLSGADDSAKSSDWPQWRGPGRDGICIETGLARDWPKGGPPLLWDSRKLNDGKSVGTGYSSLTISQGKLFTQGDLSVARTIEVKKGDKVEKKTVREGEGYLFCLDAATGKELWKTKVGPAGGDGPRCTPTVDGDRVYALTRQGLLACIKSADGAVVWQKDYKKDFKGRMALQAK